MANRIEFDEDYGGYIVIKDSSIPPNLTYTSYRLSLKNGMRVLRAAQAALTQIAKRSGVERLSSIQVKTEVSLSVQAQGITREIHWKTQSYP